MNAEVMVLILDGKSEIGANEVFGLFDLLKAFVYIDCTPKF